MSNAMYPTLPGLTYDIVKSVRFKSSTQKALSGRQLRVLEQPYPIRRWDLTYSLLRDAYDQRAGYGVGPGVGFDELRTIEGFFAARQGSFDSFLFYDPSDNKVVGQAIGTGDGVKTQFQLVRSIGGFAEPIYAPNQVEGIFDTDGTLYLPDTYTWDTNTGIVTFTSAPANGVNLIADFNYFWRVHFPDDSLEFTNFMYQLWELKRVSLESLLL